MKEANEIKAKEKKRIKEQEDKKKREEAEKDWKLQTFLKENNYNENLMKLEQQGNEWTIWEIKAKLEIN